MAADTPLASARSLSPCHHARLCLACICLSASFALVAGALGQTPAGPGQVVLQVSGADGMFSFSSLTLPLNVKIASSAGFAESPPISLPAGRYQVAADDLSGLGFVLSAVRCSDDDSSGDAATRSADIVLEPGEVLTCGFAMTSSSIRTSNLMGELTRNHALLLDSLPTASERADRLKGQIEIINSPGPLINALPGIIAGKPLAVGASLAAIDRLNGSQQQGDLDIWMKGTFALLREPGPDGRFAATTLGVDYRITTDLLAGTFGQLNARSRTWGNEPDILALGWATGLYATVRITDHLYLDVIGAEGTAFNSITTNGTQTETFDATSWLLNATILGTWELAGFTLSPRVQVRYSSHTVQPYIDSIGAVVDGQSHGVGEIVIGPGISYRLTSDDKLAVVTSLRFDATATTLGGLGLDNYRGRVQGQIDLTLSTGAKVGTTLGVGGFGSEIRVITAKGTLSLPIR